jgi:hypothetical protein
LFDDGVSALADDTTAVDASAMVATLAKKPLFIGSSP